MVTLTAKGMSLVEVLVATSLITLATVAGISASQLNAESERYQKTESLRSAILNHMAQTLNYSQSCGAAFRTSINSIRVTEAMTTPEGEEVQLLFPGATLNGNDLLGAGSKLPHYGLEIASLRITDAKMYDDISPADGLADDGEASYFANVQVSFRRLGGSHWGGRGYKSNLVASIVLQTDQPGLNGVVKSCRGLGATRETKEVCESIQCQYHQETDTCTCPQDEVFCQPGSVLLGIKNGEKECIKIGSYCEPGHGLISAIPPVCAPFPSEPIRVLAEATPEPTPTQSQLPLDCAPKTIGYCSLPAAPHGYPAGTCYGNAKGSCQAICVNGNWINEVNNCVLPTPTPTPQNICYHCTAAGPAEALSMQACMQQAAQTNPYPDATGYCGVCGGGISAGPPPPPAVSVGVLFCN